MKKLILISAFILSSAALLFPKDSLSFTYSQNKRSRTLEMSLYCDSIAYRILLRQNNDGRFSMEAPPFLTADVGSFLHVGEINDSGILSLLLNPMSKTDVKGGYKTGGDFRKTTEPAINPTLSGVVLSFENFEVISLNPAFNPATPSAFALIAGKDSVFAGAMYAARRESISDRYPSSYHVQWNRTGAGRNMVFSIIGVSPKGKIGDITFKSCLFLQNAWDLSLGGGSTSGWMAEASCDKFRLSASSRSGGTGPRLKSIGEYSSPSDVKEFSATLFEGKNIYLSLNYETDIYDKPVYGGESQMMDISFSTTACYENYKVTAKHSTVFGKDSGKVSVTAYSASAKLPGADMEISTTLNRERDAKAFLSGTYLKFRSENVDLMIRKDKTTLELSWKLEGDGYVLSFSIDQDRLISATLKFSS